MHDIPLYCHSPALVMGVNIENIQAIIWFCYLHILVKIKTRLMVVQYREMPWRCEQQYCVVYSRQNTDPLLMTYTKNVDGHMSSTKCMKTSELYSLIRNHSSRKEQDTYRHA